MGVFDSWNHACAAISTGGFSTRAHSIGAWDSRNIEAISIVLMILGNLNFLTAWLVVRGRWDAIARNSELRFFVSMFLVATAAIGLHLPELLARGAVDSVWGIIFEVLSAFTTTGFTASDYRVWPEPAVLSLVGLMIIGGGMCSTAGGIKQLRVITLTKHLLRTVRLFAAPPGLRLPVLVYDAESRSRVTDDDIAPLVAFIMLYIAILAIGAFFLSQFGYPFIEALFEISSALGTVGLSIGITGPATPGAVLMILTPAMILGRLELFVFLGALASLAKPLNLLRQSIGRRDRSPYPSGHADRPFHAPRVQMHEHDACQR
jgi:trk system potassium uptake protein TrkH